MDFVAICRALHPLPAPKNNAIRVRFLRRYFVEAHAPCSLQVLIIFVLYFGMNAVVKEKSVELFAFIIAAALQLLRTAYEYAYLCFASANTVC